MKTQDIFRVSRRARLGVMMFAACLFAAAPARAGLTVIMELAHEINNFYPPATYTNYQILLWGIGTNSTLPAAPFGDYVISSPSGAVTEAFQVSSGGVSEGGGGTADFSDYNSFIQELTNGNWTITVTNATSTNIYKFTISAPGFTSNSLPDVHITFPLPGALISTNVPTFTWQGISWGSGYVEASDPADTPSGFSQGAMLSTSQTSWLSPTNLPDGKNFFSVDYVSSTATNVFIASTPTNNLSQPISGWSWQTFIDDYESLSFLVTNHAPGTPGATPLVAHYTFDDGNLAATDSSGNGNTLSGYYSDDGGTVTITNDAEEGAHAVAFTIPYAFSGGDYYTENTNLLSTLAGSFSISMWLKTTQVAGNNSDDGIYNGAGIVSGIPGWWTAPYNTNFAIPMTLTGSKLAFATIGGGGTVKDTLHSATSINTGQWVHVVVTRNQGTGEKKIYVNGALDASDFGTTDLLNGSTFMMIGLNNGQGFNGKMDDIQFYSTVLTAGQVSQLYANPGSTAYVVVDLGTALNATNLTWVTSGEVNWFGQTATNHDGMSAAQSGPLGTNQLVLQDSILQTTVTGPGTLSFWWSTQTPSDDFDFDLGFYIDGHYYDAIYNQQPWIQETNVPIPSGVHTLRWGAYAGDYTNDAGFVDQVQFTPTVSNTPLTVDVSVSIECYHDQIHGSTYYYTYGDINYVNPVPTTTNRIESPDGLSYAEVSPGNTYDNGSTLEVSSTLDQAIFDCTNGQWKLYINKGDPSQRVFHFNLSINSLTTNLIGTANMLVPAPGAVNVASNSPFQWSGPTNASSVFIEAYQASPAFVFDGYTNLSATATSWPSPPSLLTGTNTCFLEYSYYNLTNAVFTTPVDTNNNPVTDWNPSFYVYAVASSQFSVRDPLAVQMSNSPPAANGGNFALSFQTIPGHTEIVQMRTNLLLGNWVDVTNFVGDGSGFNLSVPITNAPGKYFRVITQ